MRLSARYEEQKVAVSTIHKHRLSMISVAMTEAGELAALLQGREIDIIITAT